MPIATSTRARAARLMLPAKRSTASTSRNPRISPHPMISQRSRMPSVTGIRMSKAISTARSVPTVISTVRTALTAANAPSTALTVSIVHNASIAPAVKMTCRNATPDAVSPRTMRDHTTASSVVTASSATARTGSRKAGIIATMRFGSSPLPVRKRRPQRKPRPGKRRNQAISMLVARSVAE